MNLNTSLVIFANLCSFAPYPLIFLNFLSLCPSVQYFLLSLILMYFCPCVLYQFLFLCSKSILYLCSYVNRHLVLWTSGLKKLSVGL